MFLVTPISLYKIQILKGESTWILKSNQILGTFIENKVFSYTYSDNWVWVFFTLTI